MTYFTSVLDIAQSVLSLDERIGVWFETHGYGRYDPDRYALKIQLFAPGTELIRIVLVSR